MILLAGIDEAGLGPTLGPLVTASAALLVPAAWEAAAPWDFLSESVCHESKRGDKRLAIADSKELYKRGGMAALELSVGTFSLLANRQMLLPLHIAEAEDLPTLHPCYSQELQPFPLHIQEETIREAAAGLASTLANTAVQVNHLAVRCLYEPVLNRRFTNGMNKNQVLLLETGWHIAQLAEKFSSHAIRLVVDKQGGRNDYLPFLSSLFSGCWIDVIEMGASCSSYRIRRKGGDMEIRFMAKADRTSFTTALASMAAKYTRERVMAELNTWFTKLLPELRPTAGYPEDARRWLAEVREGTAAAQSDVTLLLRTR